METKVTRAASQRINISLSKFTITEMLNSYVRTRIPIKVSNTRLNKELSEVGYARMKIGQQKKQSVNTNITVSGGVKLVGLQAVIYDQVPKSY